MKAKQLRLLVASAIVATLIGFTSISSFAYSELPSLTGSSSKATESPSEPPSDRSILSEQMMNSVVTIRCGDSTGSGWSMDVELTEEMRSDGYRSYIATNEHVVRDCLDGTLVEILLSNGEIIPGRVFSYNTENDVASILTRFLIPSLTWRGKKPQQGWWVGVIGSPLGEPGVFTDGMVSSLKSDIGYFTAPINPGNSGGPVFDNGGRVVGLATAMFEGTNNFGIFHGSPMLCGTLVNCDRTSVWSTKKVIASGQGVLSKIFLFGLFLALIAVVTLVARSGRRRRSTFTSSPMGLPGASPLGTGAPPPPPPIGNGNPPPPPPR